MEWKSGLLQNVLDYHKRAFENVQKDFEAGLDTFELFEDIFPMKARIHHLALAISKNATVQVKLESLETQLLEPWKEKPSASWEELSQLWLKRWDSANAVKVAELFQGKFSGGIWQATLKKGQGKSWVDTVNEVREEWKMVKAYATALTTRVDFKELTENGDSVLTKAIRTAFTLTVETHEKESFMQNFDSHSMNSSELEKFIDDWAKSLDTRAQLSKSSLMSSLAQGLKITEIDSLEEEHSEEEDDFFNGIMAGLNEEHREGATVEFNAMKVQEGAKFRQNNAQPRVAETQCYGCSDMGHRMAACPRKEEIIAKYKREGGPDMEQLYQVCESLQKRFDAQRGKFQGRRGSSTKSF